MSLFSLTKVLSKAQRQAFLDYPKCLYQSDNQYVHPFDHQIEDIFTYSKNKLLQQGGESVRFLAHNTEGKIVGRIAAFINPETVHLNEQLTGGIGFFESINNQEVAFLLFDACKQWLEVRNIEAMDGPINFGSRQYWWGLLIDGFTQASYGMNYQKPYYKNLFESYGFKIYFKQYSYLRPISMTGVTQGLVERAERILQNPNYKIKQLQAKTLIQSVQDFCNIYNKTWAQHSGVEKMTYEEAHKKLLSIKPIIDYRLIWFVYYKSFPVAFFIQIPEINELIKRLGGGKFTLLKRLRFWYLFRVKKISKRIMSIVFGVVPEHRGKAIEAALAMKFAEVALQKNFPYTNLELSWIGDFNPVMMRFQQQLGAVIYKTHATYRLLFDKEKQEHHFKPCPKIGQEQQSFS
ncbi:MAG: hypothetical protein ACRCSB_02950 [Bacteroidales bacterium]